MYHSTSLHFSHGGYSVFRIILTVNSDYFLKHMVNRLIFVMVKCGVFFAVRTELLTIIRVSVSG
jgi:hypothetical protein